MNKNKSQTPPILMLWILNPSKPESVSLQTRNFETNSLCLTFIWFIIVWLKKTPVQTEDTN